MKLTRKHDSHHRRRLGNWTRAGLGLRAANQVIATGRSTERLRTRKRNCPDRQDRLSRTNVVVHNSGICKQQNFIVGGPDWKVHGSRRSW